METFIREYDLNTTLCTEFVNLYKNNSSLSKEGTIAKGITNYEMKKCKEFWLHGLEDLQIVKEDYIQLQGCLDKYIDDFKDVSAIPRFYPSKLKIQKYKPGEGYFGWHFERGGSDDPGTEKRCLVFMTYLNTVEDGGYTEFKYQETKHKPVIGKTLIWPSDWTHTHRGNTPLSGDKYIITGWYITE